MTDLIGSQKIERRSKAEARETPKRASIARLEYLETLAGSIDSCCDNTNILKRVTPGGGQRRAKNGETNLVDEDHHNRHRHSYTDLEPALHQLKNIPY